MAERAKAGLRLMAAIGAALGVLVFGFVLTIIVGLLFLKGTDTLFPVRNLADNLNTGGQWPIGALASVGAAIFTGLAVWDRTFSRKTEAIGAAAALLLVGSASAANYTGLDALISRGSQSVLNIITAIFAIAVTIVIYRWPVDRPLAIAAKSLALLFIAIAFIVVPLSFTVIYMLFIFGVHSTGADQIFKVLTAIGSVFTLFATFHSVARPRLEPPVERPRWQRRGPPA